DDHQQRRLVLVLRERIEQPARQRRLARADVTDQDAEALHLRAEMGEPDQGLRVLGRIEVETRDRRVGEGLLGQLVVVGIVHQTKPILRFSRPGSGAGSGEAAEGGAVVDRAATFCGAEAGCAGRLAIGRLEALRSPPIRCTRSLTSRKRGSSAWIAWYCS